MDEILILSPHGTKVKTSLSGCSQIGKCPLASCVIREAGELSLLSINKAKGLDSLAVIMIDTQSFDQLSNPQQQMDYLMARVGRANCWRFFTENPSLAKWNDPESDSSTERTRFFYDPLSWQEGPVPCYLAKFDGEFAGSRQPFFAVVLPSGSVLQPVETGQAISK